MPGTEGFSGHVLEVDLETSGFTVTRPTHAEWRRYAGGGLMGVQRLLRDTPPQLDPYDPRALLMFWSSVVAGQPYVGLARFAVVAKSPLTGGIGESRVEGPFGMGLKASGFDGIVIRGAAKSPSYLLIQDGAPSLLDARALWGMDTAKATDALKAKHGINARVAVIGPAGERLVRFASIVTERTHPAARMGLGAVMGSKGLKAIVVTGGEIPSPARPDVLAALTDRYRSQMVGNELTRSQYEAPGFGGWIAETDDVTGYAGGVKNFRTSRLPDLSALVSERLADELFEDAGSCPGCPNNCIKTFANSVDSRAGGLHEETLAVFAMALGITDLHALLDLNASCYLWGVDPVSLAFVVAFACELGDESLIGPHLLGGHVPAYGDVPSMLALLEAVALRRDPVAWLSEGVRSASRLIGPASEPSAMEVKGLEMVPYDPRSSAGQALAWAVSPLGPRYEIVEHDIDFDPVAGSPHALDQMKTLGFGEWAAMSELNATRVARTNALLDMWSGLDALCVSLFAGPPMRELRLRDVASIVEAVTGWETSDQEILLWGRRRWNLMRLYNLREGIAPDEDRLPSRFHSTPIDAGRHAGQLIERANFELSIQQYYELAGWTPQGVPRDTTLVGLDLQWAISHMRERQPHERAEPPLPNAAAAER